MQKIAAALESVDERMGSTKPSAIGSDCIPPEANDLSKAVDIAENARWRAALARASRQRLD